LKDHDDRVSTLRVLTPATALQRSTDPGMRELPVSPPRQELSHFTKQIISGAGLDAHSGRARRDRLDRMKSVRREHKDGSRRIPSIPGTLGFV